MKFLRSLSAIFLKDLLLELRKRERINTLLFFCAIVLFLFSFALGTEPALLKSLAPGLLWLVVLFSSLLAIERSFQAEAEEGCLDRMVLYATNPQAIFLGKLLTNFIYIAMTQTVCFLMMIILFDLDLPSNFEKLLLAFLLGNFGIATAGTFFAALLTNTRGRGVLLPILLFPMLTPLLLGAVFITQEAFVENLMTNAGLWLKVIAIFDTVFLTACLMMIEPLLET